MGWLESCVNFCYRHNIETISAQKIHASIVHQILALNECLNKTNDITYCTYTIVDNNKYHYACNLGHMIYLTWAKLWLDTVGPDKIKIINADVYFRDSVPVMREIIKFLGLSEGMARYNYNSLVNQKVANKAAEKKIRLQHRTQVMLNDFLAPWNKKLAELLNDESFLWMK